MRTRKDASDTCAGDGRLSAAIRPGTPKKERAGELTASLPGVSVLLAEEKNARFSVSCV